VDSVKQTDIITANKMMSGLVLKLLNEENLLHQKMPISRLVRFWHI